MTLLWTVLIGFVIGAAARFMMPGRDAFGFIFTTVLGIVGALVAQFLGQVVGLYREGEPAGLLSSVIGAMLVLWVARRMQTAGA
jgi:uncharacterized membrane protein YeaQ/YmgE (transglycosylase-associated protein family)